MAYTTTSIKIKTSLVDKIKEIKTHTGININVFIEQAIEAKLSGNGFYYQVRKIKVPKGTKGVLRKSKK